MENEIQQAVRVFNDGGIIIFPTDTAFGIGCRVDNREAISRLFHIRKRPPTQAAPVLVDTVKMAEMYLEPISKEVVERLIEPYWPGPLTIILYCNKVKVSKLVRGGGDTLGVRIPNHPIARALIQAVGVGILGPSANFHGEKTPYSMEDIDPKLMSVVDYVVYGECTLKQVSTVIDCTKTPWKILRKGAVDVQM